ncbi:MAG: GGDEF domain-containing protein [Nitriliruptoraceae bacterium]|nr:GGDEF domain-containing protein [Nitriliruptoraceae bacterium]
MIARGRLLTIATIGVVVLAALALRVGQVAMPLIAAAATVVSWRAVRTFPPPLRRSLGWLPAALAMATLAWILQLAVLTSDAPAPLRLLGPSAFLACYGLVVVATVTLLRRRTGIAARVLCLDALVALVAVATIFLEVTADTEAVALGSALEAALWLSLPLLMALTLGATVRLLAADAVRLPAAWLLVLAATAGLVGDVSFVLAGGRPSWLSLTSWSVVFLAVAAAWAHPSLSELAEPGLPVRTAGPWGSLATNAMALVAIVVVLVRSAQALGLATVVAAIGLLGVVVWRLWSVVREREVLLLERRRHTAQDRALMLIGQAAVTAAGPEAFLDRLAAVLEETVGDHVLVLPTAPVGTEQPAGMAIGSRGARLLDLGVDGEPERPATDPRFLRTVASLADAALRRWEALDAIEHRSLHDELTGLPNRVLVMDRLAQVRRPRNPEEETFTVLFVDLDGFKAVNDAYGHGVGDRILVEVADRLCSRLRATDTVGRIGGDEFIVLCPGADLRMGSELGRRLVEALAEPFVGPVGPITLGASVGVIEGRGDDPIDALLQGADAAMYDAKREGGGRLVVAER